MAKSGRLGILARAAAIAALLLPGAPQSIAQQPGTPAIDSDDIGGVVRGPGGPEAGVWVIAETTDLPTKFARIVVTDDQGRYVVPDLPKAKYSVWVRGYGLVDSPKVQGEPGQGPQPDRRPGARRAAAAQYYPAIYWYSMLKIPDASQFGGKTQHSRERHADRLAHRDEEHRLHRLPSARPARPPARFPAALGEFKSLGRSMDAPHAIGPGRRS